MPGDGRLGRALLRAVVRQRRHRDGPVHALQERGVDWLREPRLVQFLVIVGPVALLVLQWSMIDQLRSYVGRRW